MLGLIPDGLWQSERLVCEITCETFAGLQSHDAGSTTRHQVETMPKIDVGHPILHVADDDRGPIGPEAQDALRWPAISADAEVSSRSRDELKPYGPGAGIVYLDKLNLRGGSWMPVGRRDA